MSVLVLHTLPPSIAPAGRRVWEFDLEAAARNVSAPLPESTVRAVHGHPREILHLLEELRPDVVFNLCEAPLGRPDLEAHVASLLEWAGVRFTGCSAATLHLCRRKDRANAVLRAAGVPVPDPIDAAKPRFPCIVKPRDEDGSAGIAEGSVCVNMLQLEEALSKQHAPSIIQEFAPGREFAVSLWGAASPENSSIGETSFENGVRLITYEAKWDIESDAFLNTPMSYTTEIQPKLREAILETARGAWRAVDARHTLRIDIRLDVRGVPLVLDVNPNPEISPEVGICRAVQEAGWRWEDFVRRLVEWA